jgi:hypothetical protein
MPFIGTCINTHKREREREREARESERERERERERESNKRTVPAGHELQPHISAAGGHLNWPRNADVGGIVTAPPAGGQSNTSLPTATASLLLLLLLLLLSREREREREREERECYLEV